MRDALAAARETPRAAELVAMVGASGGAFSLADQAGDTAPGVVRAAVRHHIVAIEEVGRVASAVGLADPLP